MRALGITAPDSSVTIPVTVACSPWAKLVETATTSANHTVERRIAFFSMIFSLLQAKRSIAELDRIFARTTVTKIDKVRNPDSYSIFPKLVKSHGVNWGYTLR